MRFVYLVWTLPIQKLLLVAGLVVVHRHVLELNDLFAVVPETVFALLVTALHSKYQRIRWVNAAIGLTVAILALASWLVIVPWIVSGTPLPYQLLNQFVRGSTTLKTVIYSSAMLIQILVWLGAFVFLCAVTLFLTSWINKKRILPAWFQRTEVVILLGIATVFLIFSSTPLGLKNRFAIIAPVHENQVYATSLNKNYDPLAISVLGPPHRDQPPAKPSPFKNVLLIVLESIRYQPESLLDKGFPKAYHFNRAYVHHPRSVKTIEALLFGIYPSVSILTAAWGIDSYDIQKMDPLPRILQQNGYSGTYYAAMDLGYDNYREVLKASGFEKIEVVNDDNQVTWGVSAEALFSRIAETLENGKEKERRQFVMAWTAECHQPYDFLDQKNKSIDPITQYRACQDSLAYSFDKFLKKLEISKVLDKTLVVVIGDHGQIFSKERDGEWGHGQHVYEQSVRIPILMFVPGAEGKRDSYRLFQPVDVPSTILSALNIAVPQSWVGRNMLDPSEPGRDFVVLLSTLSDGIIGVLDKSGVKYIRNKPSESLIYYDTNVDPLEQTPLPVSKETELAIENKMNAYLDVTIQGWESKRRINKFVGRSYDGEEIAKKWGNDMCIETTPDEVKKVTLVNPVLTKGCQENSDVFSRAISNMFPGREFGEELHLEFRVMITQKEEMQGRQPRAYVKIWGMEQPIVLNLQPIANIWQTVSVDLPTPESSIDPATGQKEKDIFIGIVPVDLPIHYAVGHLVMEPVKPNIKQRLRNWSLRLKQYLSKIF